MQPQVTNLAPLDRLPIFPLRIRIRTTGEFRAPEFKGILFRGGFGEFLRMQECVTAQPRCRRCPQLTECRYSRLFETPAPNGNAPTRQKLTNAPHPFVLIPPLDWRTRVPANTELLLHLVLIGDAIDDLPRVVSALRLMGASGRHGGPFLIEAVESPFAEHSYYDSDRAAVSGRPSPWRPEPLDLDVRAVRLRFVTPLRLRTDGAENHNPDFHIVLRGIVRRLHLLLACYSGCPPEDGWDQPILELAQSIVTVDTEYEIMPLSRKSRTQNSVIPLDGVLGHVTACGPLRQLIPILQAGMWLGLGTATSQGLGFYIMDVSE